MSTVQESLVHATQASAHMLLGSINVVPADKLEWKPAPTATTVLWMLNHCATFPQWIINVVQTGEASFEGLEVANLPYEEAVAAFKKATDDLCAFIPTVPAEKLGVQMTFPWGTYPIASVLSWHEWNNTYHSGQVNYVQLLYGDTDMHM